MEVDVSGPYVELRDNEMLVQFWYFIPWCFYSRSHLWFFDTMSQLRMMAEQLPEAKLVLEYLNTLKDKRIPESEEFYERFQV